MRLGRVQTAYCGLLSNFQLAINARSYPVALPTACFNIGLANDAFVLCSPTGPGWTT